MSNVQLLVITMLLKFSRGTRRVRLAYIIAFGHQKSFPFSAILSMRPNDSTRRRRTLRLKVENSRTCHLPNLILRSYNFDLSSYSLRPARAPAAIGIHNSTIWSPLSGYGGRFNWYFLTISLWQNNRSAHVMARYYAAHSGINLPPKKCRPLKSFTPTFGHVRLNNTSGSNVGTSPPCSSCSFCAPSSTDHPDGISIETIGTRLSLP